MCRNVDLSFKYYCDHLFKIVLKFPHQQKNDKKKQTKKKKKTRKNSGQCSQTRLTTSVLICIYPEVLDYFHVSVIKVNICVQCLCARDCR